MGERGPWPQREGGNCSPKHFLVRSRGSLAAVSRGSAHIKHRGSLMYQLWGRARPRRCMEVAGGHASRGCPLSFFSPSSLQTLRQLIYLPCTFSILHPSTFFSLRPLQKMESLSSSRAPLALIKKHSEINRGCGRRSGLREEVACGVTVLLLLLLFCLDSVSSLQQ